MKMLHKSFKLNGISFSSDKEVIAYSKNLTGATQQFLSDWFSSGDFIEVQTSGSTGKPKKIRLKKEFMINSAKATGAFFNLSENTTALLCLSADYIAGKMMLVRALILGWNLDVVEPTSEVSINKKYDFSAMVPIQLSNSLPKTHNIKKLIVGGGVVSDDLIEKIQDLPTEVFATYGMTETITHIAVKKLNNSKERKKEFRLIGGNKTPLSQLCLLSVCNDNFYQVLPDVKIYTDQRNCLVIKAKKVSEMLIITNDVVQLISDTQFEWLGRFDNVINSGGIKLHPEKIEEKLSKVIKQRFFVAGITDTILGEKLILVIEGKEKEVFLNQVKDLEKYEYPKETYFIDEFVETETKKIQRQETLLYLKNNS